ncbi:hypothetical protein [Campylobacter sp. 7477a]|uniref:hypothetical protein n=1 Tax=Campylobacter sp. 7477a TaxID=2735741 RepID=UPI0030142170|nr:hypothetical protein [Campylobacter sp. 7477a]
MKFMKFLAFCALLVFGLSGCEEKKVEFATQNDTMPTDVPISALDANVTIDETLPPEPAIESNQNNPQSK